MLWVLMRVYSDEGEVRLALITAENVPIVWIMEDK